MLGPLGYTGTAAIPSPGSVVLVVFVLVALGVVLCAAYDRRRAMLTFTLSALVLGVLLSAAALAMVVLLVMLVVHWGS